MKIATNLEPLRKALHDNDISIYKLAKLCRMNHSTIYSYFHKEIPIKEETCIIIADAINMPVNEVFPDMIERNEIKPGSGDEPVEVDVYGKISINDMIVGSQTMVPKDGITLSVRKVQNPDGVEFSGYTLSQYEQVIVKTGVSTKNINLNDVLIRAKKDRILNNELQCDPFALEWNGELCVVLRSFGAPLLLSKGMVFAEIVFKQ